MAEKPEEPEMQPWAEEKYKAARVGRAQTNLDAKTWIPPFQLYATGFRRT